MSKIHLVQYLASDSGQQWMASIRKDNCTDISPGYCSLGLVGWDILL